MKITTSQIFQIGAIVIGFATAVCSFFLDPGIVAKAGGAALVAWNGVGAVLTGPQAQVQSVIAQKDDPAVQLALTKTVSSYPGVEPLKINNQATPGLIALANSNAPDATKVELK